MIKRRKPFAFVCGNLAFYNLHICGLHTVYVVKTMKQHVVKAAAFTDCV